MLAQCIRPKGWLHNSSGSKFIPFGTVVFLTRDTLGQKHKCTVVYEDVIYRSDLYTFKIIEAESDMVSRKQVADQVEKDEKLRAFKAQHAINHIFDGLGEE